MTRNTAYAALVLLTLLQPQGASAQDWAAKMFTSLNHDFGRVARGSKVEYRFELSNIYREEVHIAGVRSSCGCTTPSIAQDTLKTYENSAIVATFNTHSFLGDRSATITVTFDRPFYAEVQLQVHGYIRSDVVFDPGVVDFGSIEQGVVSQRKVSVNYAGRNDWQIEDVRSSNQNLEVELNETQRGGGRVSYDLTVRMKADAPSGFVSDQLILVTNDGNSRSVPLAVQGRIMSAVTVSPASLFMGEVRPGEKVTKQLVVRGKEPFKITGVNCADGCFEIQPSDEPKTLHLIPVTFTAGEKPGKVAQKIEIKTDLGGGSAAAFVASATVMADESSE